MQPERTIYVVDDDPAVRRSLQQLLQCSGYRAITYGGGRGLLKAAPSISEGCMLVDVCMPDISGLDLQAELRHRGVTLPLIIMTGHGNVQTAVRAMKAGAVDFLEKPFDDESLLAAIEGALARPPQASHAEEAKEAAQRLARLSRRERQVLEGLIRGQANKVIAYELGLSIRTVELHRTRMLERLGAGSLAEAVRLAVLAALATSSKQEK